MKSVKKMFAASDAAIVKFGSPILTAALNKNKEPYAYSLKASEKKYDNQIDFILTSGNTFIFPCFMRTNEPSCTHLVTDLAGSFSETILCPSTEKKASNAEAKGKVASEANAKAKADVDAKAASLVAAICASSSAAASTSSEMFINIFVLEVLQNKVDIIVSAAKY